MHLNGWSMAWDLVKNIFLVFRYLWWVFLLAILFEIIKKAPKWYRNYRAKNAGFDKVDSMKGVEFEIWLAQQFRRNGYKVKMTAHHGDHGADLILISPDGTRIAVQAKKRGKRKVNPDAISDVIKGQKYYKCDKAMVVTNHGYTQQVKDEARKFGIELIDREKLIKLVENVKAKSKNK